MADASLDAVVNHVWSGWPADGGRILSLAPTWSACASHPARKYGEPVQYATASTPRYPLIWPFGGSRGPRTVGGPAPSCARDESTPGLAGRRFALAWALRWRGDADRGWEPVDFDGVTVSRDDYTVRYRFGSFPRDQTSCQTGRPWHRMALHLSTRLCQLWTLRCRLAAMTTWRWRSQRAAPRRRHCSATSALERSRALTRDGRIVAAAETGRPDCCCDRWLLLAAYRALDRLSSWGPNLSAWFPWLADAAVINGWQHIHAGREDRGNADRHFDIARQELVAATRRGVPVYSEGLRLLVDGLHLLREDAEFRGRRARHSPSLR